MRDYQAMGICVDHRQLTTLPGASNLYLVMASYGEVSHAAQCGPLEIQELATHLSRRVHDEWVSRGVDAAERIMRRPDMANYLHEHQHLDITEVICAVMEQGVQVRFTNGALATLGMAEALWLHAMWPLVPPGAVVRAVSMLFLHPNGIRGGLQ